MWRWQEYEGLPYAWAPKTLVALTVGQAIALPIGVAAGRLKSKFLLNM
jgi:hypothetical protein